MINKLLDGSKNAVLQFGGQFLSPEMSLFKFADLSGCPKQIRLEGILYSFSETADLVWTFEGGFEPVLPLAGRGKLFFQEFHSIPMPDGAIGMGFANAFGKYFIMLDLEKA